MDEGKNDTNDPDSVKPSEEGAQESTLHAADLRKCCLLRKGGCQVVQSVFLLSHQLKSSSLLSVFSALQHPQRGKQWEAGPAGDNARGQSHRPPHVC